LVHPVFQENGRASVEDQPGIITQAASQRIEDALAVDLPRHPSVGPIPLLGHIQRHHPLNPALAQPCDGLSFPSTFLAIDAQAKYVHSQIRPEPNAPPRESGK
jgi:hypothetical protein